MSVVISAKVEVKNCSPELLREAAKILGAKYDGAIKVGRVAVYAERGALKALADSDYVSREKLKRILGQVRDAVIAAEIVRAAKMMGKSVNVRASESGIALEVF